MKKMNKKGFTLIELLVVIVILALLMVVAASFMGNAQENAKKSALQTEAKKILTNLENEAKSTLLMKSTIDQSDLSTFDGNDGSDYKYQATISGSTGSILSLSVCYKNSYIINYVDKAFGSVLKIANTNEDSLTTTTIDTFDVTCDPSIIVSNS